MASKVNWQIPLNHEWAYCPYSGSATINASENMLANLPFSPETGERDRTTRGDSPSLLLADEGTATPKRGPSCHAKPNDNHSREQKLEKSGLASQNKRKPTLLQKLLGRDIRRDKQYLLQVFRGDVFRLHRETTTVGALSLDDYGGDEGRGFTCVLQKPLDLLLRVHMPVLLEFLPHLGSRLPEHHCHRQRSSVRLSDAKLFFFNIEFQESQQIFSQL
nr:Nuclear fragile X mental retardation-interacting protein 1 [Ipomoea batatas]